MISESPQFFTATVLHEHKLLAENKDIIMDSLKFRVVNNRIILNGFVIMPDFIHLIW